MAVEGMKRFDIPVYQPNGSGAASGAGANGNVIQIQNPVETAPAKSGTGVATGAENVTEGQEVAAVFAGTEEKAQEWEGTTVQSNETIKQAIDKINKKLWRSEAIFGIHEETNRVVIKIVDKETKEVLKEYPPEKTLDMIAKAWELAGIMIDEKR